MTKGTTSLSPGNPVADPGPQHLTRQERGEQLQKDVAEHGKGKLGAPGVQQIACQLERLLKLRSTPFAVKMFERRQGMEAIERIRRVQRGRERHPVE